MSILRLFKPCAPSAAVELTVMGKPSTRDLEDALSQLHRAKVIYLAALRLKKNAKNPSPTAQSAMQIALKTAYDRYLEANSAVNKLIEDGQFHNHRLFIPTFRQTNSVLTFAIRSGLSELAIMLIHHTNDEGDSDVDFTSKVGEYAPLTLAVLHGRGCVLKALLEKNPPIETVIAALKLAPVGHIVEQLLQAYKTKADLKPVEHIAAIGL